MKANLKKSKCIRYVAAAIFGAMLILNIKVGLNFEDEKVIPNLTLKELGNQAFAQGEGGDIPPDCGLGAIYICAYYMGDYRFPYYFDGWYGR